MHSDMLNAIFLLISLELLVLENLECVLVLFDSLFVCFVLIRGLFFANLAVLFDIVLDH